MTDYCEAVRIPRRFPVPVASVLGAVILAGLTSCGAANNLEPDESITVFAASSLTGAFTDIGEEFASARPDIDVVFSFAGSTELSTQVIEGAPADVLATADVESMTTVVDRLDPERSPQVRTFARNVLEIVVARGNPAAIRGLPDLARDDLVTVLCDATVPCGRYARTILDGAGLTVATRSLESNVKAVVTKVVLGEADAGLVYATDVTAAGDAVEGVTIPDPDNIVVEYPVVALSASPAARDFVDFVMSPAGQAILLQHGFRRPAP